MAGRRGKRGSAKQFVNCDLELRPLMNVFIVLIPMLLLSAVFMEIRTIEMTLPSVTDAAAAEPSEKPLELTIRVLAEGYVVEGRGIGAQTVARPARQEGAAVPDAATSADLSQVLAAIVAARPDNHEVRIVAESSTRYQEIVALMDLARAVGLPEVALEGADMEGAR